jgi:hypothetical protein
MGAVGLFVGTKQPDREVDRSPAFSAEIKKECGCVMKVYRFYPFAFVVQIKFRGGCVWIIGGKVLSETEGDNGRNYTCNPRKTFMSRASLQIYRLITRNRTEYRTVERGVQTQFLFNVANARTKQ